MPLKCCAPGCTSNYRKSEGYITVFRFPNDSRMEVWKRKIPRQNLVITKNTRLCIKHFEERFIKRTFEFNDSEGIRRSELRDVPVLTSDAIPTLFDGLPSYLSTQLLPPRKDSNRRHSNIELHNINVMDAWLQEDIIADFNNLAELVIQRCSDELSSNGLWTLHRGSNALFFYIFNDASVIPCLRVCIKVFCDMHITVFFKNEEVVSEKLGWILGKEVLLRRWSQLQNMFSHYKNADDRLIVIDNCIEVQSEVSKVCDKLDKIVERTSQNCDMDVSKRYLVFCCEQLRLACIAAKKRRFSSDLLRVAFLLFTRSSVAYRILYESGILIMPHVNTLRRLSTIFTVSAGLENTDQVNYLRLRARDLDERQRFVCLQMDEIHVNPTFAFKGGNVSGNAQNSADQAHSVQAFMISSVFGHTTEIVSLHPVKNITAEELCCLLKKAIAAVQLSGFVVVAVSADNNQVNCKTYEILSGTGKLELSIANPQLPDKRMFLLFDTVHILKCIRNNWLNQKDPEQTFRYPLFSRFLSKIASLLTSNADESSNDELPSSSTQETSNSSFVKPNAVSHDSRPNCCRIIKSFVVYLIVMSLFVSFLK
jgi:hypothetical protein